MTNNKPKIAVHRYKDRPDDLRSAWRYTRRAGHVPQGHHGEALIRLSDYEARMAVLFDGHAVYSAMTDKAKQHTSYESVAAVLDAAVKLMREVSDDNQ